ncbi:MAG: hypothetical protein ABT20_15505 [Rubrivivax sp. SCN 70-15]|nr:MAG: hypothetical protein ABT20_15505 [Rubrivivax sp. SCN 70-15]
MISSESTFGGGVFGAISARASPALPSQRITWKLSACTPGRASAGQRARTSVSDLPPFTASTASAVRSSRRDSGRDGVGELTARAV